jgi:hypothetical protein
MAGRKLAMIAGAAAVVVVGGTALIASESSDTERAPRGVAEAKEPAAAESASRARVRGCYGRIEGSVEGPNRDATVIGPVRFPDLAANYRTVSAHPRIPFKAIAVLRPGSSVRLVVPEEQRSWLSIGYNVVKPGVAALQACRHFRSRRAQRRECRWGAQTACRSGPTLFSGGFGIRFAQAPERGRCAELIVRVRGEERQRRKYLFKPRPRCE